MTDPLISLENEIWKPVVGWEDRCQISSVGRFKVNKNNKITYGCPRPDGYRTVNIPNSKGKRAFIHRLVAMAFLGEIETGKNVNHKDGNKHNNNLINLEIVSCRENSCHHFLKKQKTIGVQKQKGRWTSRIFFNKKRHHLGCYDTEEEAAKAYVDALIMLKQKNKYAVREGS